MKPKELLINITIIIFVAVFSFILGKNTNFSSVSSLDSFTNSKNAYVGKVYEISYPWNWTFEGPTEGPITGFPEFAKIGSPSGDMQIIIGLKGDNRFEFVYDDIQQTTQKTDIIIGSKSYIAEEQFLDVDDGPEYNVAILEAEISDRKIIGYTRGPLEASLPMKIQILYRFSSEDIPFEDKLKMYETEKEEALKILRTFKLNPTPGL